VTFSNPASTTLASATPPKKSFHAPLMSSRPAGLFAVKLCWWSSSQRPLSNQSEPRVGTTISSELTSLRL
jgi:hypothetical protein